MLKRYLGIVDVFMKSTKNLANYNTDIKDNLKRKIFIIKKKGRNRKKMQSQSNEVNPSTDQVLSLLSRYH